MIIRLKGNSVWLDKARVALAYAEGTPREWRLTLVFVNGEERSFPATKQQAEDAIAAMEGAL